MPYDVFISAKSADYGQARQVFQFLQSRGVAVFLSDESLPELGSSDYRKEIDRALDQAEHMVVVTSSRENVEASWVEAEWGFFINEKRSGRKLGNLVILVTGQFHPRDLPPSLRYYEAMSLGPEAFEKLLRYVGKKPAPPLFAAPAPPPSTPNLLSSLFGSRTKPAPVVRPSPMAGGPWTNSLGMVFVPVPGVQVWFGIWAVRVRDYRAYGEANTGVDERWKNPGFPQDDTHPVVNVSWDDAMAFCAWLSRKEGKTYRLPTDAEWSVAVGLGGEKGNTPAEKSMKIKDVYPWGNQWPPPKGAGNYSSSLQVDDFDYTSPVGSFSANRHGLYDMGGNVWEWCDDFYDGKSGARVLRGASWVDIDPDCLLSSYRYGISPDYRSLSFGFRVVLGVVGSSP